jgi:nucleotide-binding universal stress UspA family protein
MTSRVVIGYDGSEASEDAVAFGLTWCRSTGDVPIVATVYPEESALGVGRVEATVPVTVVPPGWRKSAPDRISRIGVAYIDTRDAREALRMAVRVALRIPAQLTLYTVLGQSSERYSYLVGRTDEQAFWDKARDSFRTALDFAAAGMPPELEPRTVLLEGAVVESLAALGPDDVDVLVCGSRGYGPVRRVLLGGVSSRLIRSAQLPLTVVPRATTGSVE